MKMSIESYNEILEVFKKKKDKIIKYIPNLKEEGKYQDFNRRLAWDCLRGLMGSSKICDIYYNKEGLNDDHITTGITKALKELRII